MSIKQTPEFVMTLGSVNFDDPVLKMLVTEIEVETVADGPDYFKVLLDDKDDRFADGMIREGDSAKISLGYVEDGCTQVIEGTVTGVESFRREYRRKLYTIRGFCLMHRLTRGRQRRSFLNIKDSDIASQIAGEVGLGAEVDNSGIVHPYVFQNNTTNLDFLYERARRIGFEVDVDGKKLVFKKPKVSGPTCTLVWDAANMPEGSKDRLLKRCQFSTSTMGQVGEVTVRSYDPATAKEIVGRSSAVHGSTMGGSSTGPDWAAANNPTTDIQVSDQPVRSVEEAEKLAWSILNQRAGGFMTGHGQCEGDGRIRAGQVVKVTKMGGDMDGDYRVIRAVHKLKIGAGSGMGYNVDFEIARSGH